jgi:hypothetical protein
VALVFFFFCISSVQADPLRVTIVLSETGGAYQSFSDSLSSKLQTDKFALTIRQSDENLGTADMFVAVGMKASSALAARDVPALDVLIPKAGYEKLPRLSTQHASQRSAIFLDQPMERQVALLLAALPGTRDVGVLYSTTPPELSNVRRLLANKNIHLHDQSINETHSLNDALENILNESEVLFVLADAEIYNASTIRNILLTSYRKQVPLIGLSEAYVKAGALCAVYSTTEQIAVQTAEAVRQYSEFKKFPSSQYPNEFEVSVNTQVARSLDIPIKDAVKLREAIRRAP